MGNSFQRKLKDFFTPISLTELNATASFMDRMETKFLLTEQQFIALLPELQKDYYVLEIGGKSVFEYENIYMDTDKYDFHEDYQNSATNRSRVRTREYTDSGYSFFEYKQKQWNLTRKFRYQIDLRDHGKMTKESEKFYEWISMSFNNRKKPKKLSKSARTEYQRLTLCWKDSSERVTIDFEIKLCALRGEKKCLKLQNAVIIESKSTNEKCKSHKIMKKHWIHQADTCSKSALALILCGEKKEKGKLKQTIKRLTTMS